MKAFYRISTRNTRPKKKGREKKRDYLMKDVN